MENLGNKYECFKCEAKFYDLGKPEPICPRCQTNQNEAESAEEAAPEVDSETLRRTRAPREGDDPTGDEDSNDLEGTDDEGDDDEED